MSKYRYRYCPVCNVKVFLHPLHKYSDLTSHEIWCYRRHKNLIPPEKKEELKALWQAYDERRSVVEAHKKRKQYNPRSSKPQEN